MITEFRKIKKCVLVLLLLVLAIFLIVSAWRIHKRKAELTSQIRFLQQEIQALQERNQNLRAQISELEEESYWEKRIREQGYKKPGEEVAVVLSPETSADTKEGETLTFWQRFLKKLKFW